jgi:hypothetical protein
MNDAVSSSSRTKSAKQPAFVPTITDRPVIVVVLGPPRDETKRRQVMFSLSEALVPTDSPNMNNKENEVKPTQDMKSSQPKTPPGVPEMK